MQFLADLWLPILVSGVAVFLVSALVWTVLPNHKKEFGRLTGEDAVMAGLAAGGTPPGRYVTPWMGDGGEIYKTPEGKAKVEKGPIAYITIAPAGLPNMGKMMGMSLVSAIFISIFVAYLAWHTVVPGTDYLTVFRVTGTATFMAYALGDISESIWFAKPWKSLALCWLDALLYALTTAGIFGWLWP
jgi:hypothetical protein